MALATSESKNAQDEIKNLIQSDLQFLFPLLRQYPKCYWIWNHRLWDLEQATSFLPASLSRKFWQEELALVGTMLGLDCRNFHGWGYRREVIAVLETLATDHGDKDMAKSTPRGSMAQGEFDYTTKMIGTNLSNFSAWHNRTKLVLRLLDERQATDEERKNWLDDGTVPCTIRSMEVVNGNGLHSAPTELKLIHRALCDPYDQSLWFYHQNLMCSFDPAVAPNTMAPNLGDNERVIYLRRELETLSDMLDGAEDCKWIYQALIHCTLLVSRIGGDLSVETRQNLSEWLTELKKLDPLRKGRWIDLEESLKL